VHCQRARSGNLKTFKIDTTINGRRYLREIRPNQTLLDLLREELGLTGTKRGCEVGECGACTVLMNGQAVNSCLVLAPQIDGQEILTVEGLSNGDALHPLQESFLDHEAVHCGFCTPGVLMAAKELLDKSPNPGEEEIRLAISGNLCRCTGYVQIVEAVEDAAKRIHNASR
jgi:aerobic carbon-monoxide dehydrogenase small subunit